MFLTFDANVYREFKDFFYENYTATVVKRIRHDPIAWLNSLPIVEYAHVLLVITAHRYGSEPTQYIEILYNRMIAPILNRYYSELEMYRFNRALVVNRFYSMRKLAPKEGRVNLKTKCGFCTAKTRSMIRMICEKYNFLKDLGLDHPKVQNFIAFVERVASHSTLENWKKEFEEYNETEVP